MVLKSDIERDVIPKESFSKTVHLSNNRSLDFRKLDPITVKEHDSINEGKAKIPE